MTRPPGWKGRPKPATKVESGNQHRNGLNMMEHSQETQQQDSGHEPIESQNHEILQCYWHPSVETSLSCSRCGKAMCTECLVQAPVGIRCRECGKAASLPTFDVTPVYYARAVGAGLVCAVGGGVAWAVANLILQGIPFLPWLIAIGIGYAAGELISLAANRKRSKGLAWIAGGSVVVAFLISSQILFYGSPIWALLAVAIGVYTAVQRVR